MSVPIVRLKVLLQERHWQAYRIFSSEYDKAARRVDRSLAGYGPSRTQFYRWLSGDVKTMPYPDHCRVLEEMFPGWTIGQLLAPVPDTGPMNLPQPLSVSSDVASARSSPGGVPRRAAGKRDTGGSLPRGVGPVTQVRTGLVPEAVPLTPNQAGLPAAGTVTRDSLGNAMTPAVVNADRQELASAPLTAGSFLLAADALTADPYVAAADPQVIAMLAEALPHYARAAGMLGSGHLIELTGGNLRALYAGTEQASGADRRRALGVCARYAEFLGWLHQDLGNPADSLFWMDRALEWAEESGTDPQFRSYILMRKSDHAEHHGTISRVLALAQSALAIPALSPRARALALQQQASGHAQHGDLAQFERTLGQAREHLLEAEGSGDAPWGEYCDLTYLAMQEAGGRINLGQFEAAIEIIERELPNMPPTGRVDAIVFQAKLARAYAEIGDAGSAARAGLAACDGAQATGSARALAEIGQAGRTLDARGNAPEAAAFASRFDAIVMELRAGAPVGDGQAP